MKSLPILSAAGQPAIWPKNFRQADNTLYQAALCLLVMASLSGCATYYGAVNIISEPSGAQVLNLDDNSVIGTTPTIFLQKANSDRRQTVILRFKKDGYYDKTTSLWMELRHRSSEAALQNAQAVELQLQPKNGS
ncbi:MAG: hypothetical protein HKN50_06895 [Gammaproteobacteria bacterium]|nr:hypothetical protein [Gammaproteobacteria bacterium]